MFEQGLDLGAIGWRGGARQPELLERNPSYGSAQLFLMAALSQLGRPQEAARLAEGFRAQYPEYPANAFEQLWLSRSPSPTYRAQVQPLLEQIRSLGITA